MIFQTVLGSATPT